MNFCASMHCHGPVEPAYVPTRHAAHTLLEEAPGARSGYDRPRATPTRTDKSMLMAGGVDTKHSDNHIQDIYSVITCWENFLPRSRVASHSA